MKNLKSFGEYTNESVNLQENVSYRYLKDKLWDDNFAKFFDNYETVRFLTNRFRSVNDLEKYGYTESDIDRVNHSLGLMNDVIKTELKELDDLLRKK